MFVYSHNSCYLDSLLMVMYYGWDGWILKKIVSFYERERTTSYTELLKYIIALKDKTSIDLRDAKRVTCDKIREELVKFIPGLRTLYQPNPVMGMMWMHPMTGWSGNRGMWQMYPVDHVWNELAEMFHLKTSYVDEVLVMNSSFDVLHIRNSNLHSTSISFEEYMISPSLPKLASKHDLPKTFTSINTDTISSEHGFVVFYNSNTHITSFADPRKEVYVLYGENVEINKHRVFGETINDGTMELFGVIMLSGVVPGVMDSGKHYFSYIKTGPPTTSFSGWIKYDDMIGIEYLSHDVFEQTKASLFTFIDGVAPAMYFYKQIHRRDVNKFTNQPSPYVNYDEDKLTITYNYTRKRYPSRDHLKESLKKIYETRSFE